ncbi:MAG: TAT-variant-translocated molybdopterin oxidoreductase [Planctomycetes bacterium]|nr:TAT-variant-translocated molybdopterin oxidoreductase [Planctomycetota bacterium]
MKPDSTVTPPPQKTDAAPKQWQGLDEYVGSAEFLEAVQNEFPEGAAEFTDEVSRRRFVGLMGASVALATGAGCYLRPAPPRKILPYTTQPDEITPGVALYFASAAPLSGYGAGVLVRSNEGRPTKIEGNPSHPSSLGGTDAFTQASILDMYDPDRSRGVTHRGLASSPEEAVAAARKLLYDEKGEPRKNVRLRLLTETVTSPTLAAQLTKLLGDFPDAKWAQHDPATSESVREGTTKAFGKPLSVTYDFSKADVVLSLDADFIGSGPGSARYSRDFGDRRKIRKHGKTAADIHGGKKDAHAGHDHDHDHDHKEGVQPDMLNRLYVVEAMPSCTGSVADHRLALPTSLVESFARALAVELGVAGPGSAPLSDEAKAWIKPLADDLKAKAGKSIVVAGPQQPGSLHALVAAINAKLGNAGKTVFYSAAIEVRPAGKVIDLKTLTKEMGDRLVDALFIFNVNAAYSAPVDVPFGENIKNVGFTFHLGTHQDETAVKCQWHVNESHYLETWGDIRGHDGTVTLQQPIIAPLYNGKSAIELIAGITAAAVRDGYELVRNYWKNGDEARKTFPELAKIDANGFEVFWQQAVREGVIAGTASPADSTALGNWSADSPSAPTTVPALGGDFEINFRPDTTLYDGRFANNGWLQELPKPVTKLTWDNAIFMSDATAKKLGLDPTYFRWTGGEHGRAQVDVLEITYRGRKIKAPVWVLPNHADGSITVHLGYGRERAGRVSSTPGEPNAEGKAVRGFDAYSLRTSDALWFAIGGKEAGKNDLSITKVPKKVYYLACTQGQTSMTQKDLFINHEWDRKPVRHGDLALYSKDPSFAKIPPMAARETAEINENVPAPSHSHDEHEHEPHDTRLKSLTMYYDNDKFKRFTPGLAEDQQRRWAMAIDLNACTGCSACVVACQSENNIPVVGKDQVTKGRAMHWISIDRYYEGAPGSANLKTLFQPRMCVQCENAPCEIVCPVGATVHSADGLNDMTYNRCVGTRYCSNNCPYKVRRFNFLTFADFDTNTLKLGRNPDVSVRSRGVMEKCTFCVQRIRGAEIVAEREARKIKDGEILTACQSACPSGAIVFGDLNEDHSAVARWKNEPTNYGLLAELNTRPRLTHLAIVRNPNPAMPNTPKGV